jgi:hypothetical protein
LFCFVRLICHNKPVLGIKAAVAAGAYNKNILKPFIVLLNLFFSTFVCYFNGSGWPGGTSASIGLITN